MTRKRSILAIRPSMRWATADVESGPLGLLRQDLRQAFGMGRHVEPTWWTVTANPNRKWLWHAASCPARGVKQEIRNLAQTKLSKPETFFDIKKIGYVLKDLKHVQYNLEIILDKFYGLFGILKVNLNFRFFRVLTLCFYHFLSSKNVYFGPKVLQDKFQYLIELLQLVLF